MVNFITLQDELQKKSGVQLTQREIDVLVCLAHSRSDKGIASILSISPRTVNCHVSNLLTKMSLCSRQQIQEKIQESKLVNQIDCYFQDLLDAKTFTSFLETLQKQISPHTNKVHVSLLNEDNTSEFNAQKIKKMLTKHLRLLKIELKITHNKNCRPIHLQKIKSHQDYYFLFLKLLEPLFPSQEYKNYLTTSRVLDHLRKQTTQKKLPEKKARLSRPHKMELAQLLTLTSLTSAFLLFAVWAIHCFLISHQSTHTWNLPSTIPHFVSRPQLSKQILKKIKPKKRQRTLIGLYGLGGVGKTTLATHIAKQQIGKFQLIAWFHADSVDKLEQEYLELGNQQGLFSDKMSKNNKIRRVKQYLEDQKNIFLLFDDTPNAEILKDFLPNVGVIMMTSRNGNLPEGIEVDTFTVNNSLELLGRILVNKKPKLKDLYRLANTFDHLPLAIAHSAAYIRQNEMEIDDYLSLYAKEKNQLLSSSMTLPFDMHKATYLTWDISYNKLLETDIGKKAAKCLRVLALCHTDPMPIDYLKMFAPNEDEHQARIMLNEYLSLLRRYSFIKRQNKTIVIHPLVHTWLQTKVGHNEKKQLEKESLKNLIKMKKQKKSFVENARLLLPHAERLYEKNNSSSDFELHESMAELYLLTGKYKKSNSVFSAVYKKNQIAHHLDKQQLSKLYFKYGRTQMLTGNYQQSTKLLQKSLETYEGKINDNYCLGLDTLGESLLNNREPKKAKEILLKCLKEKEKINGKNQAYTLEILAKAYNLLGEYDSAKHLIHSALKKTTSAKTRFRLLTNLAFSHLCLGEPLKAKHTGHKALEIAKMRYGENHIETACILRIISWSYLQTGDFQPALQLAQKALDLSNLFYGNGHIESAFGIHVLARCLIYSGHFSEARIQLAAANKIYRKKYQNSPLTSTPFYLQTAGWMAQENGEFSTAHDLYCGAINTAKARYGKDSINVARMKVNLANLLNQYGDTNQAKMIMDAVLPIIESFFSKKSNEYLYAMYTYGNILLNTEYFQDAEDIFNQAYEKAIHRFSKNHIISLSILEAKATLAVKQKKQVLAKKLRVEILSRTEKLYDEKNIFLARALINLGHSYLVLGNKNIAEQLFKKAEIIFIALGREKTLEFENLLAMQLLCEKNITEKERLITSIDRRGSPHQKKKVDPTCFQLLTCFPI